MSGDPVVRVELDEQADACYVSLTGDEVDRTVELTDSVLVDLDRFGVVVGIETLSMSTPIPFDRLVNEFHVHSRVVEVLKMIRPDPASFVLRTTSSSAGSAQASAFGHGSVPTPA